MIVKCPKYLLLLAPVLVVIAMALSYIALAQERADTRRPASLTGKASTSTASLPSFAELAVDLAQMSNFFGGGQDASQLVTFDVEAARAAGIKAL